VFHRLQDFQQGDKDTVVRYAIFNLKVVFLRFKVTGTLSPLDPLWCKNAFQLDFDETMDDLSHGFVYTFLSYPTFLQNIRIDLVTECVLIYSLVSKKFGVFV
jgi:hypothetical protein